MARVYTGTYGSGTTAENALNTALMQYPEIARTLIQQYPRYAATYLLERTGRFATEKVLGDNSFEWKVMGRYNTPSYSNGWISSDGVTFVGSAAGSGAAAVSGQTLTSADANGDQFFLSFDGEGIYTTSGFANASFLNKFDLVRFQSGATAVVLEDPIQDVARAAANSGLVVTTASAVVKFEMIDGAANPLQLSDIQAGSIVASIGSAFPNGSNGADVGENYVYPSTHKNYLTTMRKKVSVSGKDLTDVSWIENNGSRLWYFTKEQMMMDEFMYQQELQRWYGRKSITNESSGVARPDAIVSSATGLSGTLATSIVTGDGLLAQIDSSNQASYTLGSLTEDIITEFIAKISLNATSAEGNEYVVMTGTEGRLAFHRAMKDLIVAPAGAFTGGSMQGVSGDVELGANFTSYTALGNKITIAHCPVFDDPNLHSLAGGTNSFGDNRLKESAKMVFLDFGRTSGVSNIDQSAILAANADDKFEAHVLSETGLLVRNPLSCGILSAS
jgi:hypothetical protein